MVQVECVDFYVRGRKYTRFKPVYSQKKEDSIVVQNDAYTIKDLFNRHMAGNLITTNTLEDTGNGASDFSELSPLDFLEGDLTDIDTVNNYIKDYQSRYKSSKLKQNGNKQETTTEPTRTEE